MGCWGEMTSPRRGIKHRYVCMMKKGSMPAVIIGFGGYNGGAQQPPCQDRVVLPHTSCVCSSQPNSLQQLGCRADCLAHDPNRTHLWPLRLQAGQDDFQVAEKDDDEQRLLSQTGPMQIGRRSGRAPPLRPERRFDHLFHNPHKHARRLHRQWSGTQMSYRCRGTRSDRCHR